MNERIKQLAEQAGWTEGYYESDDGPFIGPEFNKEKFAELIIRECAKFMDENSGYNDSNGCWFPEPEDMLKHFGVEQ